MSESERGGDDGASTAEQNVGYHGGFDIYAQFEELELSLDMELKGLEELGVVAAAPQDDNHNSENDVPDREGAPDINDTDQPPTTEPASSDVKSEAAVETGDKNSRAAASNSPNSRSNENMMGITREEHLHSDDVATQKNPEEKQTSVEGARDNHNSSRRRRSNRRKKTPVQKGNDYQAQKQTLHRLPGEGSGGRNAKEHRQQQQTKEEANTDSNIQRQGKTEQLSSRQVNPMPRPGEGRGRGARRRHARQRRQRSTEEKAGTNEEDRPNYKTYPNKQAPTSGSGEGEKSVSKEQQNADSAHKNRKATAGRGRRARGRRAQKQNAKQDGRPNDGEAKPQLSERQKQQIRDTLNEARRKFILG